MHSPTDPGAKRHRDGKGVSPAALAGVVSNETFLAKCKGRSSILALLCTASMASSAVANADSPVTLPEFANEQIKKHSAADDEEVLYSSRPPRTLELRRARNLLAAEHNEEAIAEYALGAGKWAVPRQFRSGIDEEWGIACERLGKNEEAMQHYKACGANSFIAKLLLKQERFSEAKDVADGEIANFLLLEKRYHGYEGDLPQWLRVRAVAEAAMHDDKSAVHDLKEAAKRYFKSESKEAQVCIHDANLLIQRSHLGDPAKLDALPLPSTGQESVIALIKYLVSSPKPFDLSKINEITGADLSVPGPIWPNDSQAEKTKPAFERAEYQAEHNDFHVPVILEIPIATDNCCLPKKLVDSLIPKDAISVPPISHWNGSDESAYAEEWKLPNGHLQLSFQSGGIRALTKVTMKAPASAERETAQSFWKAANQISDEKAQKRIDLLSKSIALDNQVPDVYVARANAFANLKHFDQALADMRQAVAIGGRPYLSEQAKIEEQMGHYKQAIEDLTTLLGKHPPGPETAPYLIRLSALYLKSGNYSEAIRTSEQAIANSTDNTKCLFIKAQAEAALKQTSQARSDGQSAAKQYFDQARIVLRDEVDSWLKTLPAN
jgi:tetratricopeptide (TPR) repeat protein